jgi:hypothetical protein
MPSSRVVVFAFVAGLVTACAAAPHPGQLLGLSSAEENALQECRAPVHAKLCGARRDDPACWDEVAAAYAALPDDPARKRYLIDAGCPSPRVEVWLPDAR